jgi:Protein of unknown function (DUF4058)
MPIHDWTIVSPGTFHDFHCSWIVTLKNALNNGVLPAEFYAQAEQKASRIGPDVITLQTNVGNSSPSVTGACAVATAPPKVRFCAEAELKEYVQKQRTLVIRHRSGDRVVAMIEILSPSNKDHRAALRVVVKKVWAALRSGCNLLILDLLPPGPGDPHGIHGAVWARITRAHFDAPSNKPLTLAAYVSTTPFKAYVEPLAVGDLLTAMPLFLDPDCYVIVPLEETYMEAWRSVPRHIRNLLAPATDLGCKPQS